MFPPIPTPPTTCKAPVVVLVDCDVDKTVKLIVEVTDCETLVHEVLALL